MKSILIAEGDPDVARLFGTVFSRHNWKVDTFSGATRAVDALRGSEHYDVVLVSYDLGHMNGVELTRLVRSLEHRKNTPLLMVTGRTGIEVDALHAGVSEVLHKPVDIYRLLTAAAKYVSRARHQEMTP